ncbi:tryptophan synthase beta subunit-like PLP-dependent enzyme [Suillus subalutaceus]|uniref:tryptophan synthase beta subunit-like PLP-dependent enzyme n=1 Tax=Suillus subalutaceus TaxID=48586 RepID=UPI001B85FDF1|nr:tryptophan synthase beta subunit-like PLP-dependent enzyme [Suillus subalutaceus]KAG1844327.1 tryptophan synthase beta subunit-like PLP-dependent enzyme [Suillus subalutaceus]
MKLFELALPPWYSNAVVRYITFGVLIGFTLSVTSTSLSSYWRSRRRQSLSQEQHEFRPIVLRSDEVVHGVTGLIGNTPLVRIDSLSDALGVEILGKAEFLNPGGSVKDRVALRIIEDAERQGLLHPHTGSRIFEGTVGSTGISIATIAKARQLLNPISCFLAIIMPDDVAQEKRVRPASIVDKKQNIARRAAIEFGRSDIMRGLEDAHANHELHTGSASVVVTTTSSHVNAEGTIDDPLDEDLLSKPRGFFADQFENRSNFEAHYNGTGPEIWRQTNSHIDAFVSGAGTGGTIAGIGQFFKSMNEEVQVVLADPEGSGLYNKVKHGVMYDRKEAEGTKRRHQVDTVVEGIGINRMTNNIDLAIPIIDDAFRITDVEAVAMSRYLVQNDGLFLGSSSACNLVACIKFVKKRGWRDGETLVTILCDSGNRHYSKVTNIPVDRSIIDNLIAQPGSGV